MNHRIAAIFPVVVSLILVGAAGIAGADIYMRTHKNGHKEFTNTPSGPGWVFYMRESGYVPFIKFSEAGKPKSIDRIIREIADEYQIDAALVKAIITVESAFDPQAVSRKGAQGLMQLMPSTARQLNVEKPFDPRENIIGGVKYIKGLIASYGDLRLALAAYNAGPKAVDKYAGIPPYRETIQYVKRVLKHYKRFQRDLKVADGAQ
ncbi:MAG: lytic transglycosylase domain-containing protein [Desulfomonile sp.]|nr:lytic transglycosylase domain-containing protein [Desulfomonile sp.]